MVKHFFMYWQYDTVMFNMMQQDKLLGHAAGQQLKRVNIGDTVWVVTVQPKVGKLILVGKLTIGWKGNQAGAAQLLDEDPEEIWQSDWHILADPNLSEPYTLVDISSLVPEVTFVSETGRDRLTLTEKGVNPQELQTMRILTPATAELMESAWISEGTEVPENSAEFEASLPDEVWSAYTEGRKILKTHYQRERNKALVMKAKHHFKTVHGGQLYCEACEFNFATHYGKYGDGFIEAHHRQPLAQINGDSVDTAIEDLAMVCANCHRMIHRSRNWLSVEALRAIIQAELPRES